MWNLAEHTDTPAWSPAAGFDSPDSVAPVFYDSVPWKGKPTRVFAWYGLPPEARAGPVPGMVLVHGGGGTAFPEWVEMWVKRGYAALALDTCGCVTGGEQANRPRHADGGPPGWGGFNQMNDDPTDQWPYHAVAAVLRGHSLLRSLPGVDTEKVGLTGISWGGFLTCLVASLDPRFAFAAPVYGCGFIADSPTWKQQFDAMGAENAALWTKQWDPASYLSSATMPLLWVNGTNDFAFALDIFQRSYRLLPRENRTLCVRRAMKHSQAAGAAPAEIYAYAEALFRDGRPLARIVAQGNKSGMGWGTGWVETDVAASGISAELLWTEDRGAWEPREWQVVSAERSQARDGRVRWQASVPSRASAHFINLIDDRGLVVSGEHYQAL